MNRLVSWVMAASAVLGLCAPIPAQSTLRVTVDSNQAESNGTSFRSRVSADGRYVGFGSAASNLVPGDTNGVQDVFLRDVLNATTERVSFTSGGAQGDGHSHDPSMSADLRYVAFRSEATNLVPGDTNGLDDIFVRDRQLGTTERVSVDSNEVQGTGGIEGSLSATITPDGRYVVFQSSANNLVPGDTNGVQDIFVRDRQAGTTERVSLTSGGVQGNSTSIRPAITPDGRYVAFSSFAMNLVPGDTNGVNDVFVRDRQLGTTERVSIDSVGTQGNFDSFKPSITADGRYVAFRSQATNLAPGDTNGAWDIYLRDRQLGTTQRVSVDSGGGEANGDNLNPYISDDGGHVVFDSLATNLVPGDTNGLSDIFVRDLLAGTTERVSVDAGGAEGTGGVLGSTFPTISADGRFVAFESDATNLVLGDTNGLVDDFLRERGGGTEQPSSGIGGAPSNGDSFDPSLSPDSRYVAFESRATNLVTGDTNGAKDVFLRDRYAVTTSRITVDSSGVQANGESSHPSVSADGRYVAFESVATNLVVGDTNGVSDVFIRDLVSGTTTRISVDSGGAQANGSSSNPSISTDGRFVAFDSAATNLAVGDTNLAVDVFVYDRQTSVPTRVSVDAGGTQGLMGDSTDPSISASGSSVAFESRAINLVPGDTNGAMDVFVRDLLAGTTTRASVDSGGTQGNGDSSNPAMSNDGGFVAFQSAATNLVIGDTNLAVDVFARRTTGGGTTTRVSVDTGGTQGLGGGSTDPSISLDGRSVAYASGATNLVAGDTNGASDVFLTDRLTFETRRVSVDSSGVQGAGASGGSAISADGRFIAFDSFASNLVQGDTNGFRDVFLRDEGTASAFESFCFGDGSGPPCPCNNSGLSGHGCENSGSTGGSILTAEGAARLTADSVVFTVSGEKPTALSIFLQGTIATTPVIYGDGLRCTGGTLKRLFVKSAVGGVVVAPQAGDLSISARSAFLNAPITLGATREYQVYYRDSVAGFCPSPPGSTFNVSNGMIVAWGG